MRSCFSTFLILVLFTFGCNEQQNEDHWSKLEVKLKTVLELPDSSNTGSIVYFSHPHYVVTDSHSRIIVADAARCKLLVFSNDGNLLYTIGERGPGPAQFRKIEGMTINNSDEILIYDRSSQTVKKFTSDGKYITSFILKLPAADLEFEHWMGNHFLFNLAYQPNADSNYILHIYSPEYKLIAEYISYQKLVSLDPTLLIPYISKNGNSHFISNDTLYFAPTLYNGFIYLYKITQNKAQTISLKLIDKIKGHTFMKPARRFKGTTLDHADGRMTMASGERYQLLIHNLSKGLFQLKDDRIVHFTYIENKNQGKSTFGVELYDKNMNPIGYAPIKVRKLGPNNPKFKAWKVIWKDSKDQFYIIDESGNPTIRVVKLEIKKDKVG